MSCGCNKTKQEWVCSCKLVGLHWTRATMTDQETWQIVSDFPTIVTSEDWTVWVTSSVETTNDWLATTTTYDLSVECCDEKVRVCAWEWTPKFLDEAIETTWAITKDTDCTSWVITIGIDEDQLQHPEYTDCSWSVIQDQDQVITPTDLQNSIKLTNWFAWYDWPDQTTAELIWVPTACREKYIWINCDPCEWISKWVAKIRLNNDFIIEQPVNDWANSWGFYMLTDSSVSWSIQWVTLTNLDRNWVAPQRTSEFAYGWLSTNITWAVCNDCEYSRLVNARFRWSIEASRWVNGLRVQLYSVAGDWTIKPVAEWRDSPISDPDVDWPTWANPDWYPDNYQITAAWPQNDRRNQWYKHQERQSFDASERFRLEPDTCLVAVLKVSSFNDDPQYDASYPAQAWILWALASDWTVSWDNGAFIEIETIDNACIIKQHQEECSCT